MNFRFDLSTSGSMIALYFDNKYIIKISSNYSQIFDSVRITILKKIIRIWSNFSRLGIHAPVPVQQNRKNKKIYRVARGPTKPKKSCTNSHLAPRTRRCVDPWVKSWKWVIEILTILLFLLVLTKINSCLSC